MSYWTSPKGVLQRARDKANPYKAAAARENFEQGWRDAARATVGGAPVRGRNAYARGWNARREYEATQRHLAHLAT